MSHDLLDRFADYHVPLGFGAPCPFCGSADLIFTINQAQGFRYGGVACLGCGARGPESRTNYDNTPEGANWHDEALRLWSERQC